MQSSERQFHLGLDARDLGHSEPSSLPGGVPDERCLADAGLTTDDEDRALATAGGLYHPVHHIALPGPAHKRRRALDGHAASLARGCDQGHALARPRVIAAKVAG